jgi:hypothetical protein
MAKNAETLLIEYGYTEVPVGLFVPQRPTSERWEKVDGGWHCYGPAVAGFGGGKPWGQPIQGSPLMRIPYTQAEPFANASGLHPADQPEAFEWVWPEARVVEIYAHVSKPGEGNKFVKVEDGKGGYKIVASE